MKDFNGKDLKRGDTVRLRDGSTGLWIVAGFDDGVDVENLAGQKLNRSPQNLVILSA